MGLDLYSKIEPFLDFEEEVFTLHKEFLSFVLDKNLDNILDIGCGQGYFLENLLLNNKTCFGIDLSSQQIEFCKQKGLSNISCTDLKDIKEKYDCATAIFDVINYIPKEHLKDFFQAAYNCLNLGGYFIFDVNSYFGFNEVAQGCITIDNEENFIAIDAIFEENKLITDLTLFSKKENNLFEKESDSITQYFYDTHFLTDTLEKLKFEVEKVKPFNLHGYEENDKEIFICKKI